MRLSHRDFRPPKRSRYVAAELARNQFAPPRKRPTLRILLLIAFGSLVYLKYDTVIQSSWVQRLREPQALVDSLTARLRAAPPESLPGSAPTEDPVEGTRTWTCAAPNPDSCIGAWAGLDPATRAKSRAWVRRASLLAGLPTFASFSLTLKADGASASEPSAGESSGSGRGDSAEATAFEETAPGSWLPISLEGRFADQMISFVGRPAGMAGKDPWCLPGRTPSEAPRCAADPLPAPPVASSTPAALEPGRPPVAAFHPAAGTAILASLPGIVAALPAAPGEWLVLRHEGPIVASYAGLARLHPALAEGHAVSAGDTLGFAAAGDSLAPAAFRLRIERNGSPENPLAFLAWPAAAEGTAHAP